MKAIKIERVLESPDDEYYRYQITLSMNYEELVELTKADFSWFDLTITKKTKK